ncbi:MAG: hypothetical protein U9N52_03475 [Campylobacterota bacterium]|nr:hypothetical protein [Campylobacterota bacterium]
MHDNFDSLLKRCKAYQRKKLLQRVGIVSILLLLILALAWVFESDVFISEQESRVTIKPIVTPVVKTALIKKEAAVVVEKVTLAPVVAKSEPVVIEEVKKELVKTPIRKDVAYEVNIDESYLSNYAKKERDIVSVAPKKTVKIEKEELQKPKPARLKAPQSPLHVSTKKLVSIEDLSKQYEKEPQYPLALKISQVYYDQKKYSKASAWAKKANMLDKELDSAWIMYAKSEYARGKRDRAKDILRLYLGNKSSKDAEVLLMMWNEGE